MSVTDLCDPGQIIHIPARDLTGTPEEKLADLDMFLAQLQVVRLALCGQEIRLDGFDWAPSTPGARLRATFKRWLSIHAARTGGRP